MNRILLLLSILALVLRATGHEPYADAVDHAAALLRLLEARRARQRS